MLAEAVIGWPAVAVEVERFRATAGVALNTVSGSQELEA